VIRAAMDRLPALDPKLVGDAIIGCASHAWVSSWPGCPTACPALRSTASAAPACRR
jgi:hypothetical protein